VKHFFAVTCANFRSTTKHKLAWERNSLTAAAPPARSAVSRYAPCFASRYLPDARRVERPSALGASPTAAIGLEYGIVVVLSSAVLSRATPEMAL
jgi:hypothetical protein